MNGLRGELLVPQLAAKRVRASLRLREDQDLAPSARRLAEPLHEAIPLLILPHDHNLLRDLGVRLILIAPDGDLHRVFAAEIPGKALDLLGPGGGPHEGLSV